MSAPDKHKSWLVTVPGYQQFTMGGDACTEAEALADAALIWPWAELKIEPAFSTPHKEPQHDRAKNEGTPGA